MRASTARHRRRPVSGERGADDVGVACDGLAPRSVPAPEQPHAQSVVAGQVLDFGLHRGLLGGDELVCRLRDGARA